MIEDEYGVTWVTKRGDPGHTLVTKLKEYTYIVLPRLTITTGRLTIPGATVDNVVRRTRLLDCMEVLLGDS